MTNKNICMLSSAHSAFDDRIFYKEAKSLSKAGYEVVIIAQHGKEEVVDNIRIIPLPIPKNRLHRTTKTVWKLFMLALKEKAEVYHFHDLEFWIKKILQKKFDVGLHGIAFDNFRDIKNEYNIFEKISKLDDFGIRMHYLRNNDNTVEYLNNTGYIFDSTLFKFQNPFKVGNLWEFPLHIMDSYLFHKNSHWQNQTLEQAKNATKRKIDEASKNDIKYFTILFHSRSFNNSFSSWKNWYIWLIDYLKNNGFEFVNYREAIKELENKR